VTSRTTGDLETIRKLGETLKAHWGDAEAWGRLGGLLRTQRVLIGYGNRRRFVAERCGPPGDPNSLDYHFICDIERGLNATRRKGYPLNRMLAVAAAYGVTDESTGAALDGGELVSAADQAPAPVPAWTAAPPPEVRMSGVLSAQAIVAAAPLATAILMRLRDFPPGRELEGRHIFLDGAPIPGLDAGVAARRWNDYGYMTDEGRVWLIAALQADEETTARPDMNVG
jgi:hypothetical protein